MTEPELLARDAQRDLNAELLEAISQMEAGQFGQVSRVAEKHPEILLEAVEP